MRATWMMLLAAGGCSSLGLGKTEQQVADPAPTLSIVTGDFNSPVGGSNITFCDPSSTPCPTPPVMQVRWGDPGGGPTQSGLGFDPTSAVSIVYGTSFSIGTLSHFNVPTVSGTAATSVSLDLEVRVDPSLPGPSLFDQTITI